MHNEASRDRLAAVALALLALTASFLMAWFITERVPHLEDEMAYLFQARVFARGELSAPPPPIPKAMFVPFVVTIDEHRIGKYPIGWPMLLAIGEVFRAGWLVNPVLNALTTLMIFQIARTLYGRRIAVLAAVLALTSPFTLIQSSLYLSHCAAAFWIAVMLWTLVRAHQAIKQSHHPLNWYAASGLALGMLLITRPYTGIAVATPFLAISLLLGWKNAGKVTGALECWPIFVSATLIALLQPLYLYVVTGSPFTNLYTQVWAYDRVGFGPDVGRSGHTFLNGLHNAYHDLVWGWASDLYGWRWLSWVPVLGGVLIGVRDAHRGQRLWSVLFGSIFASLVAFHLAYWTGGTNLGPRYYYEAHAGVAILAAYGLERMFQIALRRLGNLRKDCSSKLPTLIVHLRRHSLLTSRYTFWGMMAILVVVNLFGYLPTRLSDWYGQYNITRQPTNDLIDIEQKKPLLILIQGQHWREYGKLSHLNSPWYDGQIVVARYWADEDWAGIAEAFPEREIWFFIDEQFSPIPDVETSSN